MQNKFLHVPESSHNITKKPKQLRLFTVEMKQYIQLCYK